MNYEKCFCKKIKILELRMFNAEYNLKQKELAVLLGVGVNQISKSIGAKKDDGHEYISDHVITHTFYLIKLLKNSDAKGFLELIDSAKKEAK
jgi:hypothetical protein